MIKTSITKQVYPNGQTYWQVHASGAGPRYRKKFHSREEAEKDRARLLAGHVDVDMREVTAALQMLRTSSRPGKGASLTQAVSYFLEKCEGTSTVTIAEYAKQFIARKTPVIRAKTLAEIRSYLRHFCLSFGETRPADVIVKQLEQYLSLHTSRSYRDKVLRPFFDWLSGRKIRHCTALESPPISRSPFDFIPRFKYTKQGKVDFLRVAEVQRLIQAAVPTLSLGYVLICLFTGVRPGELRETLKLGLPHHLDLEHGTLTILPEASKINGGREVPIRPNLAAWLQWMQAHGVPVVYSRADLTQIWESLWPGRDRQDIFRHTFLSHGYRLIPPHDLLIQTGTSLAMLRKHYLKLVTTEEARQFFGLEPKDFDLTQIGPQQKVE